MSAPKPTSISITPGSFDIPIGSAQQLLVSVHDQFGRPYVGPLPVTYSSHAPNVASVSSTGLVVGVSAGSTAITVTCGAASSGTFPNIRV